MRIILSYDVVFLGLLKMSFLPSLNFGSRSSKTFKPKKNIPEGSHQHDLMKHAAATLGSGNLRLAVMLPEGTTCSTFSYCDGVFM